MKNVPSSGSVECCAESVMFAPHSNRKLETAATIPGRSGQTTTSRAESVPDSNSVTISGIQHDLAF